ncbi:uncharacterized protein EDB91DRAFT_1255997 [Suillus paluster]|uniref:uncharacterized protein n=1 Tax=Suillus paluster TaxID=48578 RepID=UPI001B87C135|nr:uncharacterized protein EDB91DRAFT_1255997 [Suillus paluster]KAG1722601.1 hypothetical protein EDB91DRAFT_1255997 [Suillus paluster]
MGKKGRQKWKKVPHPKKHRTAVQSPLDTQTVQPVAGPSIWNDMGDEVQELDHQAFHPLPLPSSLASAFIWQWTGTFFQQSCLADAGLIIHLGHDATGCAAADDRWDIFDQEESEDEIDLEDTPSMSAPRYKLRGAEMLIVDKSGAGLFPASFINPKTVFTFAVLDDFLLDNLECGTSVMNYYSKLQCSTSSAFPHLVPDRYRELMRVARQWRQLKAYKWNGFSHDPEPPKPGEQALFCPACPQPGINIPCGPKENLDQLKYTRSYVMDGNFKAEHLHPKNLEDEVWLTDGLGFMVGNARYKGHLEGAKDTIERSSCNNHRAVNQANASWHKLETTGIGGCACARHGCFVPHSMVDFQKGERQMNMDYALCEALQHNMQGLTRAITFYDINCQYHKHFHQRVWNSPYLTVDPAVKIVPGIGLWHVHGHQDSCYVRYASNFIEGTGRIDGEIMETLWAPLNLISPSSRGMSSPHQKECLDYQMNDCNFMKMIRMRKSLTQKYKEARAGVEESRKVFDTLTSNAPAVAVASWLDAEVESQSRRLQDPLAMDIYEIKMDKAPSKKQKEHQLMERNGGPQVPASRRGVTTWISTGLAIEEAQITLLMAVRRLRTRPSETQKLEIMRKQDRLQGQIDAFNAGAMTYLGDNFLDHEVDDEMDDFEDEALDVEIMQDPDEDEHEDDAVADPTAPAFPPELTVIPLPSNIGIDRCSQLANDALHNLRLHLSDKAVLFQTAVWKAGSQSQLTRAWSQVKLVEQKVSLNASIYQKSRKQMIKLGVKDHLMEKYEPLLHEQLKVSTAIADPNARGQRNKSLTWFWSVEFNSNGPEVLSVHWLRAKALRDRWAEEFTVIEHEMDWTCTFFLHKSWTWVDQKTVSEAMGL